MEGKARLMTLKHPQFPMVSSLLSAVCVPLLRRLKENIEEV